MNNLPFVPVGASMAALHAGFDGGPPPSAHGDTAIWRIGRWLRARGLSRPTTLQRAEYGVLVVDGQIFRFDRDGQIQTLSTEPRKGPPPSSQDRGS